MWGILKTEAAYVVVSFSFFAPVAAYPPPLPGYTPPSLHEGKAANQRKSKQQKEPASRTAVNLRYALKNGAYVAPQVQEPGAAKRNRRFIPPAPLASIGLPIH